MMRSRATLAAIFAALCCCSGIFVFADTTGTNAAGTSYKFVSDVQGYLDISQDVCDLNSEVDASDFSAAEVIYENGKNSKRSNGALRTLQGWALDGSPTEPHWGLYTLYFGNDSKWLNTFIEAGFDGTQPWNTTAERQQIVKKGIQSNLLVAWLFHEVDEAAEQVEEKKTDASSGAPHIVDEAAAIYFSSTCPSGSIADVAIKRAKSFGTMVTAPDGSCNAATNLAVAAALSVMQDAALKADEAAYKKAAKDLEKQIVIIFTQATLTYADEVEELLAANEPTDTEAAEGTAFFRTIAPLVAQVSAEDAKTISDAFSAPSAGIAAKVEDAFKATLAQYGITATELGTLGAASQCAASPSPSPSPSSNSAATVAASATLAAMAAAGAVLALL